MAAICIQGRNTYSKGAIQLDFAAGIKELDQENAQEEDEENFNPEVDLRDYDKVAQSLKVFCCSSRAYQQMRGRQQDDAPILGFRNPEETEIPQLQQHCKMLTEGVRASNCRRFLTEIQQNLNSLSMWAQNDGSSLRFTDAQRRAEHKFLKSKLDGLDKSLDMAVSDCLKEMMEALTEHIFEHYEKVVQAAANQAVPVATSWGAPVNREDRTAGGYYCALFLSKAKTQKPNASSPFDTI